MRWLAAILLALPGPALAESLIAARTIRPLTILTAADITLIADVIPGAADHPDLAIGMEARVAIYAGRPIRPEDLGPPALVDRNQIVTIQYALGGLLILAEGRMLDRGGLGDVVRVMNLSSRATVIGMVAADGTIRVSSPQG
ncbi:MAG: flagellar basal body P-ring formation chaperone FlgA [Paracoccaceae bacterium]